jgi:transcriptional regulator with XRE-family HTH domain
MMSLNDRHFLRTVGERIRKRREALGWHQAELGEKCELHRTFIGSVERGERNVSILNLLTISRILRVGLSKLLDSN